MFDPAAIEFELEGTRSAAAARAAFFAPGPAGRRWRDIQVVAVAPPGENPAGVGRGGTTGRSLISRRPPARQRRYERVIREEERPPAQIDYKLQICCASAVLEEEVVELLAKPLQPAAGLLAAALRRDGDKKAEKSAGFLEKWGADKEPITLGLVTMGVLVAARRGIDQNDAEVGSVLDRLFSPELVASIRANTLGPVLDLLRETRNEACHPIGEFDAAAYRAFAERLVGCTALSDWERRGPDPDPPPANAGFLHRLLAGSRLLPSVDLPPTGTAVDRITALTQPRPGAFGLEVFPYLPTPRRRYRDVAVEEVRAEPPFRLGDEVVFQVRAGRDCFLTLIDVGTSGAVSVLVPNAKCPTPRLTTGRPAYFPGPEFGEFALRLSGRAGRERLIALATVARPDAVPAPVPGSLFARLGEDQLDRLAEAVRRLPAAEWSAAACEFTIEE